MILPRYNWDGTDRVGSNGYHDLYVGEDDDGLPAVFYDNYSLVEDNKATEALRLVGLTPTPTTRGWFNGKHTYVDCCLCGNDDCPGAVSRYDNGEICYEQTLLLYADDHGCNSLVHLARILLSLLEESPDDDFRMKVIPLSFAVPADYDQKLIHDLMAKIYPVIQKILRTETISREHYSTSDSRFDHWRAARNAGLN